MRKGNPKVTSLQKTTPGNAGNGNKKKGISRHVPLYPKHGRSKLIVVKNLFHTVADDNNPYLCTNF